eukprot:scaffold2708_cov119-Cylindrotheca_fusiformis.AAC.2
MVMESIDAYYLTGTCEEFEACSIHSAAVSRVGWANCGRDTLWECISDSFVLSKQAGHLMTSVDILEASLQTNLPHLPTHVLEMTACDLCSL